MDLKERLDLFQRMVLCCHNLYLWEYDREFNLIYSNCPAEESVRKLITLDSSRQLMLSYASNHIKPIIMNNEFGMMWAAIPEKENDHLRHIHILGPFFISDVSDSDIRRGLNNIGITIAERSQLIDFIRDLPVINLSRAFEYTIMLNYCITGTRLSVSDLHYQESEISKASARSRKKADAHGTYEMEQEMIRMVREGNLDIQTHMNKLAVTGSMGSLAGSDSNRQMKNAVLVCIVLFSRAAIEGGLDPEIAMTLTDHYFQSVESSKSIPELTEIASTMQNDFVERVHRVRSAVYSRPVIDCCDYINSHLEEKISLREAAKKLNYSEQYLSRLFSKEVGMSFKEYIRHQRLDQAKALLRDRSLEIRDISERLQFCSPSYFSEQFKAEFGISPTQWRE